MGRNVALGAICPCPPPLPADTHACLAACSGLTVGWGLAKGKPGGRASSFQPVEGRGQQLGTHALPQWRAPAQFSGTGSPSRGHRGHQGLHMPEGSEGSRPVPSPRPLCPTDHPGAPGMPVQALLARAHLLALLVLTSAGRTRGSQAPPPHGCSRGQRCPLLAPHRACPFCSTMPSLLGAPPASQPLLLSGLLNPRGRAYNTRAPPCPRGPGTMCDSCSSRPQAAGTPM